MTANLDMDCLRTFASIAELGSFARAGERVGRSLSAVSLQVDRLEGQVGTALFRKDGRRRVLTEAGERMLAHAKAILDANDMALAALSEESMAGPVTLGVVQDLAEGPLATVLGDFVRANPDVRLDVRVEGSRRLVEAVEAGDLDLAVAFDAQTGLRRELLCETEMIWIGPRGVDVSREQALPLVLFEAPCSFRQAAQNALGSAGIDWRLALSSPGLSGLRAGVEAGLGITVRTKTFMGTGGSAMVQLRGLPGLPAARYFLYASSAMLPAPAEKLAGLCRERLGLL